MDLGRNRLPGIAAIGAAVVNHSRLRLREAVPIPVAAPLMSPQPGVLFRIPVAWP